MHLKSILIVDDDDVAHLLVKRAAASLGWMAKIDSVFNGREGLEWIRGFCDGLVSRLDMILLDLHMPVMDGFQFLEDFNRMDCLARSSVRVVVLSSSCDTRDQDRIRAMGVRYFIQKPVSRDKLDLIARMAFFDDH